VSSNCTLMSQHIGIHIGTLTDFFKKWRIVMCGVQYEGLSGRLWTCYLRQFMPDTLLTDVSLHIHDRTLCQDILRCTNLGSLTEKRPRKVGYILLIAGTRV